MTTRTPAIQRADELHRNGLQEYHRGRKASAARTYRRGVELLDEVKPASSAEDPVWLRIRIRLLVSLAQTEAELGTVAKGLAGLDAVRPQISELPDGLVRAELNGFVDHNHGSLLGRAGRYEESVPLLDSAIKHKERCLAEGTDDPERLTESLVTSLGNRGLASVKLGRLRSATRDLNRTIELADESGLTMRRAYAVHSLGELRRHTGDVPEALRYYEQAERIYLEIGPDMLSLLRLDQSQALLTAGLADEAAKHLDEALPHMHRQGIQQDLAEAELFRAVAALLNGQWDTSRRLASSARRRFLRRGSDAWAAVAALVGLRVDTTRALSTGKIPKALLTKAIQLASHLAGLRLTDESALARMLAVRLELHRGHIDNAADLLREVPRPGRLTPIDHRMLLRLCSAELAAAQGNRRRAFGQARAGLTELGRTRDRMGGLELVSGTALHGQELGDLAVRLVLQDRRASTRRLFDWLERTRAQTYRYEPLTEVDENPQLTELIAEIRHISHAVREARLEGRQLGELQARFAARQREAMRLGWHASRWGKPRPVAGVADVFERLGDRVLINYAASGDSLFAVVLTGGQVQMVQLGSVAEASENARRLYADLNVLAPDHLPPPLAEAITRSARHHAGLLDAQVVRPIVDRFGDLQTVIVPTGALYAVPWGVLESLRGKPVVVAPSATSWLASSRTTPAPEPWRTRSALVQGPGLPAAIGEIESLAAYHREPTVLAGDQATVVDVLSALDGAKLAHIAAHGSHEPENALFSRLELVDGALFAHETVRLKRAPSQVVLAACELALHRIRPGDEALGFAGVLLASGVNTVVAATSKVGDLPSAAAMDDYHRRLAAGAAPAVALADAVAVDPFRRPFVCLGSGSREPGAD